MYVINITGYRQRVTLFALPGAKFLEQLHVPGLMSVTAYDPSNSVTVLSSGCSRPTAFSLDRFFRVQFLH